MLAELAKIESEGLAGLAAAGDAEAVEAWRIAYLGAKGRLRAAMAGLKDVPGPEKPAVGKRLNEVKAALEAAFEARRAAIDNGQPAATGPALDMTEPGRVVTETAGRRHILTRVREELRREVGELLAERHDRPTWPPVLPRMKVATRASAARSRVTPPAPPLTGAAYSTVFSKPAPFLVSRVIGPWSAPFASTDPPSSRWPATRQVACTTCQGIVFWGTSRLSSSRQP